MIETGKLPPSDIQLEKLVLGSLMHYKDTLPEVRELLSESTFYIDFHANIYKAIITIVERGDSPDILAVSNELKRQGLKDVLSGLVDVTNDYTIGIYQHCQYLVELQKRRDLICLIDKLNKQAYDLSEDVFDVLNTAETSIKEIASDKESKYSTLDDAIVEVCNLISLNNSDTSAMSGTPTGIWQLDHRSGGLQKSDLIIIGARTSQGKTSLAIHIALEASEIGAGVAIYSMEMKKEQLAARMLSIKTGISANQILYSRLRQEHFEAIDGGVSQLKGRKIYFDDRSTSNIDTIISSIRTLKNRYGIDGAIIDYIQILNVNMKGASPEQQMGTVARRLKNLAKELDMWIIALSQLSRDNANPIPSLNQLRDSGQIEEAADVVLLIYRPEVYGREYTGDFKNVSPKNTALIDVAKGRNIGLLKFIVGFDSQTTKFYEISELDTIKAKQIEYDDTGKPLPF